MSQLFIQSGKKLECLLCPHYCKLSSGQSGICLARANNGEKIELLTYGVLSGYSFDPIEKKPLYHFFPGHDILSIGSYGCNLKCDFCQNFNISQNIPGNKQERISPEKIVTDALSSDNNIGIAFTYNEPIIWYEFMKDVALCAKSSGLYTAMVSNGYVNSEPLNDMIQFIDAFNIDLKAFNNDFYRKLCGSDIEPVKKSLKQIAKSANHLEITTLIIPGQNDNIKEVRLMSEWIAGELGKEVPVHLSKYFPVYRRDNPATSQESMQEIFEIVSEYIDNVYLGNLLSANGNNTCCPNCGKTVAKRTGYKTELTNIDVGGKCSACGTLIFEYFTFSPLTKS